MNKYKTCPECGSNNLGERWVKGRKLVQYCEDEFCHWESEPRVPEKRRVTNTKTIPVDNFAGWSFVTYDKYGYEITYSQSYPTESQATKALERELTIGRQDQVAGPYTAVLFYTPAKIKIEGKLFQ